jgi:hypothetical protein
MSHYQLFEILKVNGCSGWNENISNTNSNIYITSISLVDFVKYLSVLLFFIFTLQGRIVHCVSILLNQYNLFFFRYGY